MARPSRLPVEHALEQPGTAVRLVEQNVRAGLALADRGYILDMGENQFEGPADALLDSERVRDLYLGRGE